MGSSFCCRRRSPRLVQYACLGSIARVLDIASRAGDPRGLAGRDPQRLSSRGRVAPLTPIARDDPRTPSRGRKRHTDWSVAAIVEQ